jgi:iron complex transport system ATP-binding protein
VLRGVTLTGRGGEAIAVVGPNGTGKTTLLRCLAGIVTPREGRVTLDGEAVGSLSRTEAARRIAVVPQVTETMFPFTVREIVALGRTARLGVLGNAGPEDLRAVEAALAEMDLATLADARIDRVSGGERQRAVVAMALAQGTDVLLLDEPTTHLDPAHQRAMLAHARELARRRGILVVAVLHDLNLASAFSTRTVVLHAGRVLRDAPPHEALDAPTISAVFGDGLRVINESGRSLVVPDPIN